MFPHKGKVLTTVKGGRGQGGCESSISVVYTCTTFRERKWFRKFIVITSIVPHSEKENGLGSS